MENNVATLGVERKSALEPAGVGKRFLALMVDGFVMSIVILPFYFLFMGSFIFSAVRNPDAVNPTAALIPMLAYTIVAIVIQFFYAGYFLTKKGATPGKLLLGLKVLNSDNHTHLSWKDVALREVIGKGVFLNLLFIIPLINFVAYAGYGLIFFANLILLFNPTRRLVHDLTAKSQVFAQ